MKISFLRVYTLVLLFSFGLINHIFPYSLKQVKFLLNTTVEITIEEKNQEKAKKVIELAFEEIKRIEKIFNRYDKKSEISFINQWADKKIITVSSEIIKVIKTANKYSLLSSGAFDITITPLIELWQLVKKRKILPTPQEIEKSLLAIGFSKILLDEEKNKLHFSQQGVKIDLGGIAKGYAVDKAIEVLKKYGIKKALVNAGGDIYALGYPFNRDTWRLGIQHPFYSNQILGIIKLKDEAVATSGNYERFFELNGKKYCHIINPKTGFPVEEKILSVTIIASSAIEADALATAIFVLGEKAGMKLAEKLKNVEAIMIVSDKRNKIKILLSSGIKGKKLLLLNN